MQTVQDRIDKCVRRYCTARSALLRLDPHGDWKDLYLPLTEDDNRGPGKEPDEISSSNGQYTPSWIWHSNTMAISPDEVNDDMRVEWAQCAARADRWEEEAILLQEEMKQVVQFLEWRSSDWLAKVDSWIGTIAPAVRAGLSAYANKQARVFHNLAVRFSQRWGSALASLSLPHVWATEFLELHKETLESPDFKKQKGTEHPAAGHPRAESPPLIAMSTDVPPPSTTFKSVIRNTTSDIDSDGASSEYDGSEYDSATSCAE